MSGRFHGGEKTLEILSGVEILIRRGSEGKKGIFGTGI